MKNYNRETIPETVNKPCVDECVYEAICPPKKLKKTVQIDIKNKAGMIQITPYSIVTELDFN